MDYWHLKALRPKTMMSYEQSLKLFAVWLKDVEGISQVEQIREGNIRRYIMELQTRGKYTVCVDDQTRAVNHPANRSDYNGKVGNITINNYLRNLRVFFNWLEESECITRSPMKKIHALPQERRPRDFMSDEEVKALVKSMDKSLFSEYRDLMVMMLMLDTQLP